MLSLLFPGSGGGGGRADKSEGEAGESQLSL